MTKEERVVKYINSSDDFVVNGKRYYENDFYNDVEDLAKENQELKKQLEKYKRLGFEHLNDKCNKLEKENKILRENAEHNDKVVDKVNWGNMLLKKENQELKNQLETLEKVNNQLISKLDRYDAIVDERDELKKQLRTSAIFNEEDIRLDQTKEVFETLANILNTESCSYRYLIYDLLGFKEENYIDLIAGMSITNAIVELEELENQQKEFIDYLENEINKIKEQIRTYDIWHEVGVDINFLILKKQFFIEILSKYKEIIGVSNEKSKDK